jgi:sigma-B regulation protein RsbU (phosphoserine phosphatase)
MNTSAATLRLVSDEEPASAAFTSPAPSSAMRAIDQHVDSLQGEIDTLKNELNVLRRRDETINYYMLRLDEEMRLAARLQQDFLPRSLPQVGNVHFHTLFRPAGYVSGDLYDVMRLDEHHVGFYMCDAVGHGMPAALLTMFIKQALVTKEISATGYRLLPPAETMRRLNDALISQNLTQATFATAIYGIVDTQTMQVTFSRGGHPSPLMLRRDGQLDTLDVDGSLLGIFPDDVYGEMTVQLETGDRLFIYSDGVEVAFSEDQTLDTQKWQQEIRNRTHLAGDQLVQDFADHLDRECGSLQPKDDLTMIVVEVR